MSKVETLEVPLHLDEQPMMELAHKGDSSPIVWSSHTPQSTKMRTCKHPL
ncbi:Uncharacterised protein [uncultured archaeon]|nr:Uncharacterised protein [uncultured archaeon]